MNVVNSAQTILSSLGNSGCLASAGELALRTEAHKIGRQYRGQHRRADTDPRKRPTFGFGFGRDDVVGLQQLDLIDRDWRGHQRHHGGDAADQRGETEGQRYQRPLAIDDLQHRLETFAERQHFGAAKFVDRPARDAPVDSARDDVGQRVAWRTVVRLAQAWRDTASDPNVASVLDDRLVGLSDRLAAMKAPWARSLARTLRDRDELAALLATQKDKPAVPPGMPIGDSAEYMDLR